MRSWMRPWLGLALLIAAMPVVPDPLELDGELVQGGVVVGRAPEGSKVRHAGRELRVGEAGHFVIGFDRDAPATATVTVELPDGETIRRELRIEGRDYRIQRIDGLPPSKVTPGEERLARIREEAAQVARARETDAARTDFLGQWIWPVTGPITGVYGSQRILNGEPRRPHYGIDIAAPTGTPVQAPADGVVTLAHPDMFFSGGTLIVDHGHGLSSAFLHLERILVAVGERVERGDVIAEVGATGRVTGAHLDWRMNWFERRVDPAALVPPMPGDTG